MKRIFIAIRIEPGVVFSGAISSMKSALINDSVKWTDLSNYHITLVFLGNTEEDMIVKIESMLKERCEGAGKFVIKLKGAGVFRSMHDPKVLWTGIEPSEKLNDLNREISSGLKDLNINIEDRPFNPHLTIGRIKHVKNIDSLKLLIDRFRDTEIQQVEVNDIILYESILLQAGPLYKKISVINL